MKTFAEYIDQNLCIKMPEGTISGEWFYEHQIPMVVACCCCRMTMASPSAWIDDEGYIYCSDCADVVR